MAMTRQYCCLCGGQHSRSKCPWDKHVASQAFHVALRQLDELKAAPSPLPHGLAALPRVAFVEKKAKRV
jgi:hypothetical protein